MKNVALCLAVLLLTGCGAWDRQKARWTGDATSTCIDGVMYLQFTSGATVAYDRNGHVKLCGAP